MKNENSFCSRIEKLFSNDSFYWNFLKQHALFHIKFCSHKIGIVVNNIFLYQIKISVSLWNKKKIEHRVETWDLELHFEVKFSFFHFVLQTNSHWCNKGKTYANSKVLFDWQRKSLWNSKYCQIILKQLFERLWTFKFRISDIYIMNFDAIQLTMSFDDNLFITILENTDFKSISCVFHSNKHIRI